MVAISIAYCHFACDFVIQCPLRYSHIITFTLLKEIIESMFSDYNGTKLAISNTKISGETPKIWKLKNLICGSNKNQMGN